MADRVEREIEEILAKLDEQPPADAGRKPISILAHKDKKREAPKAATRRPSGPQLQERITPATLLFAGAGAVIGGLILSSFWSPLIWVSFAGVVLFIAAFAWSFRRTPPAANGARGSQPNGYYWRDRWIEYEPANAGMMGRLKRKLRRR